MVDVARKVVGVGSVGTRANVALMLGRDGQDPLFLQMKEAQDSVLAPFAGKSLFKNQGQRVVEGQRLMQATSDIFLGWIRSVGDRSSATAISTCGNSGTRRCRSTPRSCYRQASRSTRRPAGGRSPERTPAPATAIAIGAYLGKKDTFDQAIADFSEVYADQNERDYQRCSTRSKAGGSPRRKACNAAPWSRQRDESARSSGSRST